jgi:hypothetical protein
VAARWFACAADAEEAIADYEGRGQGRRGRTPPPWRYHALHSRVETDTDLLQAYQAQHLTVEPGFRWIKNPAAMRPVWLEKSERIAALAMLTVVGFLVSAVLQRQVRLYLRAHDRQIPGNQGPTAILVPGSGNGAKCIAANHTPLNVG